MILTKMAFKYLVTMKLQFKQFAKSRHSINLLCPTLVFTQRIIFGDVVTHLAASFYYIISFLIGS